ncbi:SDR family oxidoreductase [Haloechinothrix alba]|uniref:SDR family oxidoreductase n=1 Tax=Haloechinothrix alba TaxID=664784 RepID=UPI001FE426B1|nr:SDR family oxidoreductase [Haloechinothrix alba]
MLDVEAPDVPAGRFVECDSSNPASTDDAVDELGTGRDVVCNVAGLAGTAPAELVMRDNFPGHRHVTERLPDRMNDGVSLVAVASMARFGRPRRLEQLRQSLNRDDLDCGPVRLRDNQVSGNAYSFSKEAATVYVMTMVLPLAERGLRINAVSPGPAEEPVLDDFATIVGKDDLPSVRNLVGRYAESADIAPVTVHPSSGDSAWIKGSNIIADGGIGDAILSGVITGPDR